MEELQDYNGELRPVLKIQDLSKDALGKLWTTGGKMYIGMSGVWFNLLKERLGDEKATELSNEFWGRIVPLEVRWSREALNLYGDDVATVLKICQVDPGFGGICDLHCELKNNNEGILTVRQCRALDYWERHGDTKEIENACGVEEEISLIAFARTVNPNIKVRPLKLPPRKSRDEIACQWEFKLEPKD